MAVMDSNQQEILRKLERSRVTYEEYEEWLANWVSDEKWKHKEEMRNLVREARDAGVPYRQIGFALKTSDHRTLRMYEANERQR